MKEILATEGKTMIFTEDFKNTLHLVEDNEEDMCLVRDMARRFVMEDGVKIIGIG